MNRLCYYRQHYSSEPQGQLNYHQYPISSSILISSYEDFKTSRRRLRNLQDDAKEISEKLRDELNATSVPAGTDGNSYDDEDGEDPNNHLLAEYWSSFPTNNPYDSGQIPATDNVDASPSATFQEINQDESFVQIPAPLYAIFLENDEDDPFVQISPENNGYTSLDGLTSPFITPPQSSEDISLPLEPSEDIYRINGRGYGRTRRTRKLIVDARKTGRKYEI
ncbi:e69ae59f-bc29-45bd-8069-c3230145b024 [Sclerotinia trifoliorum]|uniref:E69ae59f-bc29-45bd-8069-c3230145b024 n=1 Tax=Sclerotinia trifoliorum TaxID=28548 RepID=A0A8H2ZPQ5_9HELO|nr:e69ae59f-bc29-45bd-8069-c3230145b024 [Sclerotinia trifoliorum]